VKTNEFYNLSKDDQMDTVAFLISMEKKNQASVMGNYIYEQSIRKELCKLISKE